MREAALRAHPRAWRWLGEPAPKLKRRPYSSKNGGAIIRIKNRKLIFAWRERGLSGQSAACQAATCILRKRKGAEASAPGIENWRIGPASSLRIRRRLQREIEPRFRRDLHLLALGQDLYACSRSTAHRRADRRAFAATGYCADERT